MYVVYGMGVEFGFRFDCVFVSNMSKDKPDKSKGKLIKGKDIPVDLTNLVREDKFLTVEPIKNPGYPG